MMEILRGKWIVVEGPDRIGKSTLINNLKKSLYDDIYKRKKTTDVVVNGFPRRKTRIGTLLDKSLLNANPNANASSTEMEMENVMSGETQTMLFLADMLDAMSEIKQRLEYGDIVITDRYIMSTYAYALAQYPEITREWICNALSLMPLPDVFIYLTPKSNQNKKATSTATSSTTKTTSSTSILDFVMKRAGFGGEKTERKEIQENVLRYMNELDTYKHKHKRRNSLGLVMQQYARNVINDISERIITLEIEEHMTPQYICNDMCMPLLTSFLTEDSDRLHCPCSIPDELMLVNT